MHGSLPLARNRRSKYTVSIFFEKKIIVLGGSSGFEDDMYDILCISDQFFGAAALLLEGGSISAAWPPIFRMQ